MLYEMFLRAVARLTPQLDELQTTEEITIDGPRWKAKVRFEPKLPETGNEPREIDEAIMESVGKDTLYAKEIAEKSGYAYSSHLREALARLVKQGRLVQDANGYRCP